MKQASNWMYNYIQQKLLNDRNQNGIYSTATLPPPTTKGSTWSAKTREVENVVAAKFASIAVNCAEVQTKFWSFQVVVMERQIQIDETNFEPN